jgi:hypothetical protein
MRTNVAERKPVVTTHEGARAVKATPVDQLRRSVMACMLFEDTFYEDGVSIADRIHAEVADVLRLKTGADIVGNIAYEARTKFKLRHAPLWLIVALIKAATDEDRAVVAGAIASCVQRPDEMAELIAMYWKDGKRPLTAQMKKGLAAAFQKFDRYSLSKYANKPGQVAMRDVLFLVHAKPQDEDQIALFRDLAENKLKAPDTWESNLSAGKDKKTTFERLIAEKQLGALALLRNLRNMQEAGVEDGIIRQALAAMKTERVLPFRFITAARYAPKLEPELETAMFRCLEDVPKLQGKTLLLVDNSGSMYGTKVSAKSEIDRSDAACALAMLLREVCDNCQVIVFADEAAMIRPRRGFALRDEIKRSRQGGTDIGNAVRVAADEGYDRIIVITDEQTMANGVYNKSNVPDPLPGTKGYFINVACYQNGVGYRAWTHIDGFSEATLDFIQQYESQQ